MTAVNRQPPSRVPPLLELGRLAVVVCCVVVVVFVIVVADIV